MFVKSQKLRLLSLTNGQMKKKNSKMQEEEEKHGGSDGSSSNSFQHRIGSVLAHVYILNHSCYWRLHNGQVFDENS